MSFIMYCPHCNKEIDITKEEEPYSFLLDHFKESKDCAYKHFVKLNIFSTSDLENPKW